MTHDRFSSKSEKIVGMALRYIGRTSSYHGGWYELR